MVVARVSIPDELDRFIGSIKDNKGFNTKNDALNFIIKEYERTNGMPVNKAKSVKEKAEEEKKPDKSEKKGKKLKKLQQNHINEIKSVLNGE